MSGTILVSRGNLVDIRTVGFEWLAEEIRSRSSTFKIAKELLQSVDEFGMDMICADELDSSGFKNFNLLMEEIFSHAPENKSFVKFIEEARKIMNNDARMSLSNQASHRVRFTQHADTRPPRWLPGPKCTSTIGGWFGASNVPTQYAVHACLPARPC